MDMRKYTGGFLKPDDVRDGPTSAHIVDVQIGGKFNRPILELDTGRRFSVNETNTAALIEAYGSNSEDWLGHALEFSLGSYEDFKTGETKANVAMETLSKAN